MPNLGKGPIFVWQFDHGQTQSRGSANLSHLVEDFYVLDRTAHRNVKSMGSRTLDVSDLKGLVVVLDTPDSLVLQKGKY